jgi:hypothetical protein
LRIPMARTLPFSLAFPREIMHLPRQPRLPNPKSKI